MKLIKFVKNIYFNHSFLETLGFREVGFENIVFGSPIQRLAKITTVLFPIWALKPPTYYLLPVFFVPFKTSRWIKLNLCTIGLAVNGDSQVGLFTTTFRVRIPSRPKLFVLNISLLIDLASFSWENALIFSDLRNFVGVENLSSSSLQIQVFRIDWIFAEISNGCQKFTFCILDTELIFRPLKITSSVFSQFSTVTLALQYFGRKLTDLMPTKNVQKSRVFLHFSFELRLRFPTTHTAWISIKPCVSRNCSKFGKYD